MGENPCFHKNYTINPWQIQEKITTFFVASCKKCAKIAQKSPPKPPSPRESGGGEWSIGLFTEKGAKDFPHVLQKPRENAILKRKKRTKRSRRYDFLV
jgi:hypothetical protein